MNMTRNFLADLQLPLATDHQIPTVTTVTLLELATLIRGATDLTEARRTKIANALDRVIALLPDAGAVPADAHAAVTTLGPLRPHRTGLKTRTLSNYKCLINAAVRWRHGDPGSSDRHPRAPAGAWSPLYQGALTADLKLSLTARSYLTRFMRDCSARGIQPEEVSDTTIAQHIAALEASSPDTDSWGRARMSARGWNVAVTTVPGWPATILELPSKKRLTSFPAPGALSSVFERQFANYVTHMQGRAPENPAAASGKPFDLAAARSAARAGKPIKPTTIESRCYLMRRAAGLLSAATGREIDTITMPELGKIENVETLLNQYAREIGKEQSDGLSNLIDALKSHANTFSRHQDGCRWRPRR